MDATHGSDIVRTVIIVGVALAIVVARELYLHYAWRKPSVDEALPTDTTHAKQTCPNDGTELVTETIHCKRRDDPRSGNVTRQHCPACKAVFYPTPMDLVYYERFILFVGKGRLSPENRIDIQKEST